jgi:hypothetical protein
MDRKMILAALPLVLMIALPARAQDSSPGMGDSAHRWTQIESRKTVKDQVVQPS